MHQGGEKKESICRFVYELVFVYANSTSFEHSISIYRVEIRNFSFVHCTLYNINVQ
jgi:hypothetical protein